jgi:hypothetical protein
MKFSLSVVVLTASALLLSTPFSLVDAIPRPGKLQFSAGDKVIEYDHAEHVKSIGFFSLTIKNMLEDLGVDAENVPIPIPNILPDAMTKLLAYAKELYAAVGTMPVGTEEEQLKAIEEANKAGGPVDKFIKANCNTPELAIDYMNAANYLDNKHLLHGLSKNLAAWIEGKRKAAEDTFKGKTFAKGETMEDAAAKIWVLEVNKMFGYEEQVQQQPAQPGLQGGAQEGTQGTATEEKSVKSSSKLGKSRSSKTKTKEPKEKEKKDKTGQ